MVHLNRQIYESSKEHDEDWLRTLSNAAVADGKDALSILLDQSGRYHPMPDPSPETKSIWIKAFLEDLRRQTPGQVPKERKVPVRDLDSWEVELAKFPELDSEWQLFLAEKHSEMIMTWLRDVSPQTEGEGFAFYG